LRPRRPYPRQQQQADGIRRGGAEVDGQRAAAQAVHQAADHGPANGSGGEGRGAPGDRVDEVLFGHQQRQKGLAGWMMKRSHGSIGQQNDVNRMDGGKPAHGETGQGQRTDGEYAPADAQDGSPLETVGGMPGNQKQQYAGKKLG